MNQLIALWVLDWLLPRARAELPPVRTLVLFAALVIAGGILIALGTLGLLLMAYNWLASITNSELIALSIITGTLFLLGTIGVLLGWTLLRRRATSWQASRLQSPTSLGDVVEDVICGFIDGLTESSVSRQNKNGHIYRDPP